jgi:hypothetical protein
MRENVFVQYFGLRIPLPIQNEWLICSSNTAPWRKYVLLTVSHRQIPRASGRKKSRQFGCQLGVHSPAKHGEDLCVRPGGGEVEKWAYFILLYSIIFYSNLFYSILFYSILFYSILFYSFRWKNRFFMKAS